MVFNDGPEYFAEIITCQVVENLILIDMDIVRPTEPGKVQFNIDQFQSKYL